MIAHLMTALRRNPYPAYATMRRFAPVFKHPSHDLWLLFDYENVKRAMQDNESFSSRAAPPGGASLDWLIFLDAPVHTRLRALIARAFTPRAVAGLEPRIVAIVDDLLEAVIDQGSMDVITDFAAVLPLMVISELLGFPLEDRSALERWTDAVLHLGDMVSPGERSDRAAAAYRLAKAEMEPFVRRLIAERRAVPQPDLLTRLAEAEIDGARLSDGEILGFFQLLLLAGTETTTCLIGNTVTSLLEFPEQLAWLRRDPALLPAAIEEVLRYRTPAQAIFRTTARDVTIGGRVIPAGRLVLAMVGSANRDGRQFPNPNAFDIGRAGNHHIAFGHGIHFCVGSALARLEARIAISALLARFSDIQMTERRWEPQRALNVYGPARLPVRFRRV